MLYFKIGDISVPRLGFGTWQLRGDDAVKAVSTALETGYRHIDTAAMYDNEREVGKAIADSGVERENIFLTTKIWQDEIKEGRVVEAADECLSRLGTDYVDLLLLHWPLNDRPIAGQVEALARVRDAGKARLIGVSNYNTTQLKEAIDAVPDLANMQAEYHPELDQDPILSILRERDMLFTSYSPIGQGKSLDNAVIKRIAEAHGKSPGQVVLRWHLQQENVAAIPKSGTPDHIRANFDIFDFELSDQDMKDIFGLVDPNGRLIDPDWAPQWDTGVAA